MKQKFICTMLIIFGNFVSAADLSKRIVHILSDSFSNNDKEELLTKIRLIGQANGYNLESKIGLNHKIIWLSAVNNPRVRYGYIKFLDVMEDPKDFEKKSIFWKNKYIKQDSLEDDINKAIGQNYVILQAVHCLRAARIEYKGLQVKYTDESCSIQ